MADNNTIKIGGVSYNKETVKSSEVIVKDGKKVNSVFLKDGTHIEYPTQSENNKSTVSQSDHTYSKPVTNFGYNFRTRRFEEHLTYETVKDPSVQVTNFNRITNAKITGTENSEHYHLNGCTNCEVDVSQNDGKPDKVVENTSRTGGLFTGTDWKHGNNTFKLNDSDTAEVRNDDEFFPDNVGFKGKGTFKSKKTD